MGIGQRIRALREEKKISRADLAAAMGIAVTTLSDLELGESKSTTALHKAAARLRTNIEYLETGRGNKHHAESSEPDWVDVRGYAQAAGLGAGAEAEEYAETHKLKFKASSMRRKGLRPDKLSVFYGKGDSMEPRIKSGDAILFDTSDVRPQEGTIYLILWKGEYYAKRAMILDDVVYFTTDNQKGDHNWVRPRRMDAKRDPIEIVGRVRWIGSWED